MQRTAARGRTAIFIALCAGSLMGCGSMGSVSSLFGGKGSEEATAVSAKDDSTCQSSGFIYGSPEYQQCLQNLAQQKVTDERAENKPYYVMPR